MADKKITALTELTATGKDSSADLLHIIDFSASPVNKKISVANLFSKVNTDTHIYGASKTFEVGFAAASGAATATSALKITTGANNSTDQVVMINADGTDYVDFTVKSKASDSAIAVDAGADTVKINGDAANVDTQISGDTVAALLYVDAGLDTVGIGAAPTVDNYNLEVASLSGKSIKTLGDIDVTGSITASANATVTGNVSMGGLVHLTQAEGSVVAASADGTGAAAIPVTTTVTYVSNTTGGNLYCDLANGTTEGQIKIIICTAIGGSSPVVKITPASIDTVNSFDLNAVGEAVTLLWHNAKWICIGAHMNAVTA